MEKNHDVDDDNEEEAGENDCCRAAEGLISLRNNKLKANKLFLMCARASVCERVGCSSLLT